MNRGPFIFIGVLIIVSLSWAYALVKPLMETGRAEALLADGVRVPPLMSGLAAQGREVYQEQGCIHCHTQQIRVTSGSDVDRGWGDRMTVAMDYFDQSPAFTGVARLGPDLSNVGERRPDKQWHLLHLYNPRLVAPDSTMPAYPFLFEKRQIVGQRSNRALELPAGYPLESGYEIMPSRKAEALAAYMASLRLDYDIPDAPSPERINYVDSE